MTLVERVGDFPRIHPSASLRVGFLAKAARSGLAAPSIDNLAKDQYIGVWITHFGVWITHFEFRVVGSFG